MIRLVARGKPSGRTLWRPFSLALIGAAILVRVGLVAVLGPPSSPPPLNDHVVYYETARGLAQSQSAWIQPIGEFGYRAPLYFAFLAGWFVLDPELSYRAAQIATSLLGVLASLGLGFVGLRLGNERTALASLGLRAFLPCYVISDTFVMSEPLFAVVFVAAFLLFLRIDPEAPLWVSGSLGGAVGLGLLVRESAGLLPFIFGAFLLGVAGPWSRRALRVLAFAAGIVLCLTPWLLRNREVWGRAFPLAQTAGINLYIGNNADATGKWGPFRADAPREIAIGTPEANEWFARAAARYIAEDPVRFFLKGFRKLAWLLFPEFHRDSMTFVYRAPGWCITGLSVLSGLSSAFLILAGAVSLILAPRTRGWWLVVTIAAYQAALSFLAFGAPRFRDPIDHLLVPFAALAISSGNRGTIRARLLGLGRWQLLAILATLTGIAAAWGTIALLKATGRG